MCDLAQGGMFKVVYAEISNRPKTESCMELSYHQGNIQGSNFSIKGNSIVQLKAKINIQSKDTKVLCTSIVNCK